MGKPATGGLRKLASGYEARIRIEGKTREGFALTAVAGEAAARERCTAMATIAARLRRAGHAARASKLLKAAAEARTARSWASVLEAVDLLCTEGAAAPLETAAQPVTFGELAREWTSGKIHARFPDHVGVKRTSDTDALRLGKWIYPIAEHIPLSAFTLEHAQEIMRRIPATKARATRRSVAQLIARVLNLAVYPCKHLERSPIPKGFLPRIGKGKAMTYLYPDEDRRLLASDAVPYSERLLFGVLAREGVRCEEALSLRWLHLDLERGSIRVDVNKTDQPRTWALDAGVVAALRSWKAEHPDAEPGDRVFPHAPTRLAARFRGYLKIAGITRAELFERSDARRPIRAHDLRATFVTVNLANGKTEAWISDRTGHTSSTMISRYRRSARAHSELGQGTLTPLDEALGVAQSQPTDVASGGNTGRLVRRNADRPTISAGLRGAIGDSSGCEADDSCCIPGTGAGGSPL